MATSLKFSSRRLRFLKLGGSLITDKKKAHTARPQALARLVEEIRQACSLDADMRLLIGHGSGSFGHVAAEKYNTLQGVRTPEEWRGFCQVWQEAAALNHLVLRALSQAGLPVVAFPPSSSLSADQRQIIDWPLDPIRAALNAGLIPVVYGDVVFDQSLGGTILSTEDLFEYLAAQLQPGRILIASLEKGIWGDYPECTQLIPEATPADFPLLEPKLSGSEGTDVTGGMASKARLSLRMIEADKALEVLIFSGEEPGAVKRALAGDKPGTWLHG
jgi:isopentenyl phosphate kinase